MIRAALLLITMTLSAMAPAGASDRLHITFINPGGDTEFWGDVTATMSAAAKDLNIDLNVIHTNRDRLKMVDAARNLARADTLPDYIIIVNELQQAPLMLDVLADTGVPVFILLNRMTQEQRIGFAASGGDLSQIVGSIVTDNEVAGYDMAMSLIQEARSKGLNADGISLMALLGDAATPAALEREEGLRRALQEHPDVSLIRAFPVMWSAATAYERTQTALQRYDLDAVWAANDQIALGARAAALASGKTPGRTILFAGLNWSIEGLRAVRDGDFTMTHGGHFFAGAWSMIVLRDIEDGALPRGSHLEFPMSAVRSDAVHQFLMLIGKRAWDRIDYMSFRRSVSAQERYAFDAQTILSASSGTAPNGSLRPTPCDASSDFN
ncbi:MAG: ABC transporter substrate-binding protein [Pseudomonadota bacterium]